MPDRPLPQVTDPLIARTALQAHMAKALEGYRYEYDGDRAIYVFMNGEQADGTEHEYLLRLTFLFYPDWPPSVTFLNPETRRYDRTHWPKVSGSGRVAFYPSYGDAPTGLVCNSMTFEYYFWGGHSPREAIRWKRGVHTFAATLAEIRDHLRPPHYQGRAS